MKKLRLFICLLMVCSIWFWWSVFSRVGIMPTDHGGILRSKILDVPLKLNQPDAAKACESYGLRLATIFELTQYYGRIYRPERGRESHDSSEIQEVSAVNQDGSRNEFQQLYYPKAVPESAKQWKDFYWSSSSNPKDSRQFYALDSSSYKTLSLETTDPDFKPLKGFVQCLPKEGLKY